MKCRVVLLVAALGVLLTPSDRNAMAHSGGLDANGGHYNRKTGEYHFHRNTTSTTPGIAPRSTATAPGTSSRTEALIRLLVRKGLITESELLEELRR